MASRKSSRRFYLSYQQQSLWLLAQVIPCSEAAALNLCYELGLHGPLELDALRKTVTSLGMRHPLLGARVFAEGGEVWQVTGEPLDLQVVDLRASPSPVLAAGVQLQQEAQRGFNLDNGNLSVFKLFIIGDQSWRLLINLHHIIADGHSIEILRRDLAAIYSAIVRSREPALPPAPPPYSDFVTAQLLRQGQETFLADESYWTAEFSRPPALLELRPDFAPPGQRSFRGSQLTFTTGCDLIEACHRESFRRRVPLSAFMLAGFTKLLLERSGQPDIVIGTSFAGRDHRSWREGIGLYINTVPLRFSPKPGATRREFVQHVGEKYLKAHEHQDYPLQLLLARLPALRNSCRPALFPAAFNFHYLNDTAPDWGALTETVFQRIYASTTLYELVLHVAAGASMRVTVDYCTDLFSEKTIAALVDEYIQTLRELCREEYPLRSGRDPLPEHERQTLST